MASFALQKGTQAMEREISTCRSDFLKLILDLIILILGILNCPCHLHGSKHVDAQLSPSFYSGKSKVYVYRRSYLVPIHLVLTHFVPISGV